MHSVLITFDCQAPLDELHASFTDYATALTAQPGLISKVWIRTESGYGGFHVFQDRDAADAYLSGELAAGLQATDGFDNFEIEHYDVIDDLSAVTGVSEQPIRAAAS